MRSLALTQRWMTLAYDEVGTGLPVVLLHAFPFDREMWSHQLAPLSAAGFRILAPDLPEFGKSTPGSEPFIIERVADVVADYMEALHISSAVIAGLSMGGYVAMAFARRHPSRLAALILADTKAAPDDEAGRDGRDKMIATVMAHGTTAAIESLLPKLLCEQTRNIKPEVVEFARKIAARQSESAVVAALYALRDRPDATRGLAAVAVPTLVLVGEHDTVTPPLLAARIAAQIAGSELQHIPGAGHLSNIENPVAFNAAVIAFLKQLK
jgi:3-oxoadipate enol-lactonase